MRGNSMTQNEKTPKDGAVVSQTNTKKNDVKPTQVEYVKFSQMKQDDILKLSEFPASVVKTKSKRNMIYYTLTVKLHNLLKLEIRLSELEYNLIVAYRKLEEDRPINSVSVWVRLIEGVRADDENEKWRRYEIFVCNSVTFDDFFNDQHLALMKIAKIELPFVKSAAKINEKEDEELTDVEKAAKYKGVF